MGLRKKRDLSSLKMEGVRKDGTCVNLEDRGKRQVRKD